MNITFFVYFQLVDLNLFSIYQVKWIYMSNMIFCLWVKFKNAFLVVFCEWWVICLLWRRRLSTLKYSRIHLKDNIYGDVSYPPLFEWTCVSHLVGKTVPWPHILLVSKSRFNLFSLTCYLCVQNLRYLSILEQLLRPYKQC